VEDEDYQLRYERVAGIDVAKAKADVCTRLPPAREGGRRVSRLETVAATAREVLALAGRLIADGVEVVVMESTSDYWRIWYYLLESAGLNVQLVNSRHARQLAGRPKTDLLTELPDVSAVQEVWASLRPIVGLSQRSRLQAAPAMTQA
jgi:transposase